jgi:hypothetical protein
MLRWMIPLLAVLVVAEQALAADQPAPARRGAHAAAGKLPPGLPRAHYNYRTTVDYDEPGTDVLISPTVPTTPLLPGSAALPGYYGRAFSYYYYQGSYYGGSSYVPYFFRLPYACGVTGYC